MILALLSNHYITPEPANPHQIERNGRTIAKWWKAGNLTPSRI
jgi:hypothetical protein